MSKRESCSRLSLSTVLSACALALSAAGPAAASSVVVGESFSFRSPAAWKSAASCSHACRAQRTGTATLRRNGRSARSTSSPNSCAVPETVQHQPWNVDPRSARWDLCEDWTLRACHLPRGQIVTREAADVPVSYKMSVNTRESSATFSNSSLVYYHFARYFDASIHVPPAVLRTIDSACASRAGRHAGRARICSTAGAADEQRGLDGVVEGPRWRPSPIAPRMNCLRRSAGRLRRPAPPARSAVRRGIQRFAPVRLGRRPEPRLEETPPFVALRSTDRLEAAIDEGLRNGHAAAAVPVAARAGTDGLLDARPRRHHAARLHLQSAGSSSATSTT